MNNLPLTIQINDERAIRIVIDEAERRGIKQQRSSKSGPRFKAARNPSSTLSQRRRKP
jgi:hypothetical protein